MTKLKNWIWIGLVLVLSIGVSIIETYLNLPTAKAQ